MAYTAGVDVGGTFTDVTLVQTESGRAWAVKTPSTPRDQSLGFVAGLEKAAKLAGVPLSAIERCFHGTTVATNAILQRSETRLGLLTTAGFASVLEIGRHDIPRDANYFGWSKPERPVKADLIREVSERIDCEGRVLRALDDDEARKAIRSLRDLGVESYAVSLLYSFLNPAHELRLRELLAEEQPGALVSLSCEVLPRFREFERTMTTVLNAYVAPHVGRYLGDLERRLRERGCEASLLIMKSNGGVVSAAAAARQAIHTAVSGPAAGVIGAVAAARAAGYVDVISIDVGGTSADVCLTRGGWPETTTEGRVGGFPMEVPMLDVQTIGAGGGSIAWLTSAGGLAVGPRSAGAEPGPACYGRGGTEPTVTDANLLLGRLPAYLLGGELALDAEAARRAIETTIAAPLGLSAIEAAEGILAIADNAMLGAIRTISIARGLDPRGYALIAFGGAGPLHAPALASALGIETIVIPPRPGVLSTEGLLRTDLRNDYVRTCTQTGPLYDVAGLNTVLNALFAQANADLEREGVPLQRRLLRPAADLRYRHQNAELSVDLPDRALTAAALAEIEEAFHREHERLYTYALRGQTVELVNLRVAATGLLPHAESAPATSPAPGEPPAPAGARQIYFGAAHGWLDTPLYTREALRPGHALAGPLAVDQLDTTTVLRPGDRAHVDARGNLIVRVGG
ncbi:MAG TPA: hydantoinase/oxoprolinase family protein [Dehalococcoidia bacterium]|nr:hydantoinase/oxoprolinase family protein [Dehalococcoidia bacterium]